MKSSKITFSILAHVDAGKTTLAESMLYLSGTIRNAGRVDHGDTFLDNYEVERERGITVFSKQAEISFEDKQAILLDTPGHVDFSAEMERTLQVTDYAILLISGSDGIQGHVLTLWRLLGIYNIPVFIFINKMDQEGNDKAEIMNELKDRLSGECIDFSGEEDDDFYENLATGSEEALEEFFENGLISDDTIKSLITERKIFPCYFGSALKMTGVSEFMSGLARFTDYKEYDDTLSARIYKISRDSQGNRLTHMKLTGGKIQPKMMLGDEKINQIRIISGGGFKAVNEAVAGDICAVTGLDNTYSGQGIGNLSGSIMPVLEPVMVYRVSFEGDNNVHEIYLKIKQLEEEEPELHIVWNEENDEINIAMMGEVQTEILKRIFRERYNLEASFDHGSIVYKETIARKTEGVGHYEPLRHYAEVHIIVEPAERGSGVTIDADCPEDKLAKNWQRLIMTNLGEKTHRGILTGGELTDVRISVVGGRAHLKHTEGGDFRQASYRAVRHALMKAGCILLEPVYNFRLELPYNLIGRGMSDIQKMCGRCDQPETQGDTAILTGTCPVSTMQGYQSEVAAYSSGMGKLFCTVKGYEECHNTEEVIAKTSYDPAADIANPAGSIFCSHGAGYYVSWEQVEEYMHVDSILCENDKENDDVYSVKAYYNPNMKPVGGQLYYEEPETYQAVSLHGLADKELEDIFVKTYGEIRHKQAPPVAKTIDYDKPLDKRSHQAKRIAREKNNTESYLLVDGYNIIFAWDELKKLSESNLDAARTRLLDIMCNYQGYRDVTLIVVFDAYKVKGKVREVMEYNNIYVVYTKEAETADQYIEKSVHKIGSKHKVTVATSDGLEQIIIFGQGAIRMSAANLKADVEAVNKEIGEIIR